jgi:hypothetical protein
MKKNTKSYLIADKPDFSQKINSQITIGREIFSRQITSHYVLKTVKNEMSKCSYYIMELLKQSLDNSDNEYLIPTKGIA